MDETSPNMQDMHFHEDEDILVFKYRTNSHRFDLIYQKEKDKVLLLKDQRPVNKSDLEANEVASFEEALQICICYHHNKENELTH